ncbi:MAG TPA: PIN domain-containing protein [Solirubrobacterales bacterium]|nr:PIN domain-containing protein [Solirubrobacterales bacterium]
MSLLLDTSVLIAGVEHPEEEVGISAISIAELHFGLFVATDENRAVRLRRLAAIESAFDPLPFDADAARECGRLQAVLVQRGGRARRRAFDLAIAATAKVHGVPLLTFNAADFKLIEDLVDVRSPD